VYRAQFIMVRAAPTIASKKAAAHPVTTTPAA